MPIHRLDHYSVRTTDVQASEQFYTEILGFEVGFRPPFDFPGIWLYNGQPYPESNGVVHIIGIDANNPEGLYKYLGERPNESPTGTGTVDHMAFLATGVHDMRMRLKRHNIPSSERLVPALGLLQVFLQDPSGVTIELNYPATEAQAAEAVPLTDGSAE